MDSVNGTNSTNITEAESLTLPETLYFTIIGTFGVLINSLVLYVAIVHVDFNIKIFVVSMTAADCLYCVCYQVTRPIGPENIPLWLCGPYYMIVWMCQIGSVMFLLCLNIDKFLYIYFPLHYCNWMNERTVPVVTCSMWTGIVLIASFSYYGPVLGSVSYISAMNQSKPLELQCRGMYPNPMYWLVVNSVTYVLPLILSLIMSICIFIIAQSSAKQRHASVTASTANRRAQVITMKRIFFVFSSTMWTSCTLLPYRVVYLFYAICERQNCTSTALDDIRDYLIMFMQIGPLCNPIITIVTQRTYRTHVCRLWRRLTLQKCGRCYDEQENETYLTNARLDGTLTSLTPIMSIRRTRASINNVNATEPMLPARSVVRQQQRAFDVM